MNKPQDFFGASPKTVLNKPFFHAQDQKAYNVAGGSSIADVWTKRTLNTVIHNDIQGASLANNEVSLPAGTYYVEGNAFSFVYAISWTKCLLGVFKDGTSNLLNSGPAFYQVNGGLTLNVSGVITLTNPGIIDLRCYVGIGVATTGFGLPNSDCNIADTSIPSIYADLKIWRLDRSLEIAPKAINSGLQTIAGMNTEGNIMGFDVTVSGNTLTITKGSCMSSDLTVPLAFTTNKTCVLPGTVNGDFYVFAVRLLDGVTYEARAYTTYAGPSSDAQIDKWRLLSFAKNNGSGVTMPFKQANDRIDWLTASRPVVSSTVSTAFASVNIAAIFPVSIVKEIGLGSTNVFVVSYDGTTAFVEGYAYAATTPIVNILPVDSISIKNSISTTTVYINSVTLRR